MTDLYRESGVDTKSGELAVELMKSSVLKTHQKNVVGDFGGFVGLFDVSFLKKYDKPLLATSTDGVGTKIKIAQMMDKHDTIGIDLVAMVADDIVVCGAKPIFMTDYIAIGKVDPLKISQIVLGISAGCLATEISLIGGETAEHSDLMSADDYDIAGAGVGVVEEKDLLKPENVKLGDLIIGMKSSGLHSNGYSLVRKIIADKKIELESNFLESSHSVGEELLIPTKLYTLGCLALKEKLGNNLHALSHITGGGIAANIARVIPTNLHALISRTNWQVLPIFNYLKDLAKVDLINFEQTFNLGLGMVAIVDKNFVAEAMTCLEKSGIQNSVIGEIQLKTQATVSDAPPKGGLGGSCGLTGKYS
jgi:phosphoribosylformylglycinamidine cyclo-ligase